MCFTTLILLADLPDFPFNDEAAPIWVCCFQLRVVAAMIYSKVGEMTFPDIFLVCTSNCMMTDIVAGRQERTIMT